jgi:hypothetical protein
MSVRLGLKLVTMGRLQGNGGGLGATQIYLVLASCHKSVPVGEGLHEDLTTHETDRHSFSK